MAVLGLQYVPIRSNAVKEGCFVCVSVKLRVKQCQQNTLYFWTICAQLRV